MHILYLNFSHKALSVNQRYICILVQRILIFAVLDTQFKYAAVSLFLLQTIYSIFPVSLTFYFCYNIISESKVQKAVHACMLKLFEPGTRQT